MRNLLLLLTLFMAGCATTDARIGQPVCDQPIPVDVEIWNDLGKMRETMSHNQLAYEECIEKLRTRIRLHDGED